MRSIIREILIGNEELTAIIPAERWYGAGAVSEDNTPASPFAVMRFGVVDRGMAEIHRGNVTIWIHDTRGTYRTVDNVLSLIAGILDGREHVSDALGNELIRAEWLNTSGDLFDTGYRTITRNATYNVVGRGV